MYSSAHENEDPYEDQNDREYLIDLTGSASGIFAECTLHQKQEMTRFFLLLREFFLEFSISLAVLFKKQPDVIINFSDDPLNDVERVYNRDCVGKILIYVRNILVVHVGNEIFYSSSLFHWKGGKVGFCDIRTSTAE